jgi:hypothetical protein
MPSVGHKPEAKAHRLHFLAVGLLFFGWGVRVIDILTGVRVFQPRIESGVVIS